MFFAFCFLGHHGYFFHFSFLPRREDLFWLFACNVTWISFVFRFDSHYTDFLCFSCHKIWIFCIMSRHSGFICPFFLPDDANVFCLLPSVALRSYVSCGVTGFSSASTLSSNLHPLLLVNFSLISWCRDVFRTFLFPSPFSLSPRHLLHPF
jgi:hypothetical protein